MSDVHQTIDVYREQNRRLARWLTYSLLWGVASPVLVALLLTLLKPVGPKYFRSSPDGRLVEMVPLDRPYLNQSQVMSFATDCVYRSFGLDFHKWRQQITQARECFTEDGYDSYQVALEKSGNLTRMQADRLVATPFSTGPCVIASEGVKKGVYTWLLQQPIAITWENSGKRLEQRGMAEILVTRVPTTDRPSALAIEAINIRSAGV